jgi:hypothetical protein
MIYIWVRFLAARIMLLVARPFREMVRKKEMKERIIQPAMAS